jgi:hypothetical protein
LNGPCGAQRLFDQPERCADQYGVHNAQDKAPRYSQWTGDPGDRYKQNGKDNERSHRHPTSGE